MLIQDGIQISQIGKLDGKGVLEEPGNLVADVSGAAEARGADDDDFFFWLFPGRELLLFHAEKVVADKLDLGFVHEQIVLWAYFFHYLLCDMGKCRVYFLWMIVKGGGFYPVSGSVVHGADMKQEHFKEFYVLKEVYAADDFEFCLDV